MTLWDNPGAPLTPWCAHDVHLNPFGSPRLPLTPGTPLTPLLTPWDSWTPTLDTPDVHLDPLGQLDTPGAPLTPWYTVDVPLNLLTVIKSRRRRSMFDTKKDYCAKQGGIKCGNRGTGFLDSEGSHR